MNYFRLSLLSQ